MFLLPNKYCLVSAGDAWLPWYLPTDCLEDRRWSAFAKFPDMLVYFVQIQRPPSLTASVIHKCFLLACYPSFAAATPVLTQMYFHHHLSPGEHCDRELHGYLRIAINQCSAHTSYDPLLNHRRRQRLLTHTALQDDRKPNQRGMWRNPKSVQ